LLLTVKVILTRLCEDFRANISGLSLFVANIAIDAFIRLPGVLIHQLVT